MAEVQTFQIKDVQHTRFIPNVLKFAELVSHAGGKNKFIHIQSAASGDNEGLNKLLEFLFTMFKALFAPRKQTICEILHNFGKHTFRTPGIYFCLIT